MRLTRLQPKKVETWCETLVSIYYAVYSEPPYHEPLEDARAFGEQLLASAGWPGFRCFIVQAESGQPPLGFAWGYTCAPGQPWYETVTAGLDPATVWRWFGSCFELVELALRPEARGRGLGGQLHDAILHRLPHRTAALNVLQADIPALHLYRRRGWIPLRPDFVYPQDPDRRPCVVMGLDLRALEARRRAEA